MAAVEKEGGEGRAAGCGEVRRRGMGRRWEMEEGVEER